ILGNVTLSNEASGDVVAVLGNVKLATNAIVHGDTVSVLGNIEMGPNTRVRGDVVAVGGAVERGEGSVVDGEVMGMPGFKWLGEWLEQCVFKLRPLAPQLGWLWTITGIMLAVYLLIAVAFPRPVQACVDEITRRPVTTVLMGLLTKILVPFVFLILVATGVGLFVVPFLVIALMCAGMIGKIALLQYFGQQIGRQFNLAVIQKPLMAFLLGWVILTLLYLVPVLGFIVYTLVGLWALGAVVLAMFSGRRREMPERTAAPPPGSSPPPAYGSAAAFAAGAPAPMTGVPPVNAGDAPAGTPDAANHPPAPPLVATPIQTSMGSATVAPQALQELLSYPRAGFWERMGAAFLDIVVVGIIPGIAHGPLGFLVLFVSGPPVFLIIALAYFAGLWAWKGTTIGGIVLKLHVVRCDGQPVTFLAALVRGLAAALSVIVLFLGFLWIAWDHDKQGWHDKIAGTIVVRLPRSLPLVCL
ncbi:MAG TPA: RDD family protein, partial [Verrucomicrobiae bacterium]